MREAVDEAKRWLWRERLARFARSKKTVAAFCSAEQVSVQTFYQWKRKLAAESSGRTSRQVKASTSVNRAETFLPVRIEGATLVELELPNGARVRVPASDLTALGAAIAAAGQIPAPIEGESPRC